MLIDTLAPLWADTSESLMLYVKKVNELRLSAGPSASDETISHLHERLVETRNALDEIESYLSDVGQVRARCRQAVYEAEQAYDDAWRATMERTKIGEYTSAKERDATYTTGAVDELVRYRKAKKILADVEEAYEAIQLRYRGLDNARRDIDSRTRMMGIEATLSR